VFSDYIDSIKEKIIKSTIELINIPSVFEESNDSSKPFGENCNKALEYILNLGEKLGFKAKNIDGYCGYIEFGTGKDIIGIIGHLDVVPAVEAEGWTTPPFCGTIKDNKIFGRGAIDDKGPVIASLYAMKAVYNKIMPDKRVRLILGLNEETNWECIKYYKEKEELPTVSFSPDADFPCIYAEKGRLSICLKETYNSNADIVLTDLNCSNNAINVVPRFCSATLKINNIDVEDVISRVYEFSNEFNIDIELNKKDDNSIEIISHGVPAHAAHVDLGVNAISKLLVILYKTFNYYNIDINILNLFYKYINTETNGKSLNLNIEDESGKLTLNVGNISLENGAFQIGLDLRVPVQTSLSSVIDKFKSVFGESIEVLSNGMQALYIDKNNFLVTTLCNIFNKFTNANYEPIAIGGATYARAFDNCISFGPSMPGDKDMCHQVDEFISIDNLILSAKIYAQAIYELLNKD